MNRILHAMSETVYPEQLWRQPVLYAAVGQAAAGAGWPGDPSKIPDLKDQIDSGLQESFRSALNIYEDNPERLNTLAKMHIDAAQVTGSKGAAETVKNWQASQGGD